MIHLAIQTAVKKESISVFQNIDLLEVVYIKDRFSDEALEALDEAIQMAGIEIKDIEFITIVIGTGSFTGLKSGLAFAKGVAYPNDLPLVGVTSLRVLLESVTDQLEEEMTVVSLLDARNKRAYYQVFEKNKSGFIEKEAINVGDIKKIISTNKGATFIGSGVDENKHLFNKVKIIENVSIKPETIGKLGFQLFKQGEINKLREINPLYVSDPKITISKKK